jgi:hypothetical protein
MDMVSARLVKAATNPVAIEAISHLVLFEVSFLLFSDDPEAV